MVKYKGSYVQSYLTFINKPKKLLLLIFVFLCLSINYKYAFGHQQEIIDFINHHMQLWNQGDVVGYLRSYCNRKDTLLSENGNETIGFDTISTKTRLGYKVDAAERGLLTIDNYQVTFTTAEDKVTCCVTANWILTYPNQKELKGKFALELIKENDHWCIWKDYTTY